MSGMEERAQSLVLNLLRRRAVTVSRHYKRLFMPTGRPDRDAEIVLADLREFSGMRSSGFSTDPLVMARNAGRREVMMRISDFLDLDESQVAKMMEVEDE